MNFVVLSSSHGTVFQTVLDAMKSGALKARCLGMVSDSTDRGCIEKAKAAGLPVTIVEHRKAESREDYDHRLDEAIRSLVTSGQRAARSDQLAAGRWPLIACIGWMYILSPWFVRQWKNRIVNVHPALLPKHPGAHAHELVLTSGDTESGMTIHLVDEGVDTGPILLQKSCPVLSGDTVDTLKTRVQELEKEWYPKVLQMIHTGELKLPA